MAGLDPAIHVFASTKQDVDARDKRGHDDERWEVGLVFFILDRN
jgi:hypothetical protein